MTLYYLEGTQPTSYCDYHENGANLKRIAVERLQGESMSVGQKPVPVDSGGLELDPDLFNDPSPKGKTNGTSGGQSPSNGTATPGTGTTEGQGSPKAPVYNPLLE